MRPARVTPHPSETALSGACQKRVREVWHGWVLKVHGSASQTSGMPDLLCCILGRLIAVELKQPGKKPTALQMKRLRDLQAAGAVAGWATTEAEFEELLARHADAGWVNPQLA